MKLSNNKKRKMKEMVDQAAQACASGRFDICAQLCGRIESIQPGNPDVANIRAIMSMQAGQQAKAEQLWLEAVKAAPNRGEFQGNLGQMYLNQGRYAEAVPRLRQAMELDPRSLPTQLGYCKALLETGRYEEAYPILDRARKRHPSDPIVLMGLYCACQQLNRIEEGRACLENILEHQPDHAEALFELGVLDNQAGRFEQGEAELRSALASRPDYVDAYTALAEIKKFVADDDADISAITAMLSRTAPNSPERAKLAFSLGKIMDDLGHYDRAFEYFREANAIRKRHGRYDNNRELAHLRTIMETFTPEMMSQTSGLDDPTPVFILGMPRCGSTLVDQILVAHPEVAGVGESSFFEHLLLHRSSDDDPLTVQKLASFAPEQWRAFGQDYLHKLRTNHPDALRITDKSLRNIRLIGAIHCALPKARIVHVRRHPLDTCLSIFKTDLRDHLFDYGCSLDTLGEYYLMYLKLMQHWRDVLPAGVMYELDYENLIAHQEGETRKLLDACGLPWNEACLQFNQTENIVRTASVAQVRRPVYTDSQAAWKRYKKHLKPLMDILGTKYPKIR
jgi:tetratricopeptide (TPR) repeat protein